MSLVHFSYSISPTCAFSLAGSIESPSSLAAFSQAHDFCFLLCDPRVGRPRDWNRFSLISIAVMKHYGSNQLLSVYTVVHHGGSSGRKSRQELGVRK